MGAAGWIVTPPGLPQIHIGKFLITSQLIADLGKVSRSDRGGLLILLFVLLLALLLDVKLWFFPLFFVTFIFLSNVTHDNYSFLVGLSLQMTDSTVICSAIS